MTEIEPVSVAPAAEPALGVSFLAMGFGLFAAPVLTGMAFFSVPVNIFIAPMLIGSGVGVLSPGRRAPSVFLALFPGLMLYVLLDAIVRALMLSERAGVAPDGAALLGAVVGGCECGFILNFAFGVPAAIVASRLRKP